MFTIGNRALAEWHLKRADAQRRRFECVAECGAEDVVFACEDCGHHFGRSPARCSHYRLCLGCRGRRAARYRATFCDARRRALANFSALKQRRRARYDWRERMLTLTIPHSGDVRRDLQALPKAWKIFRRGLWQFFEHEHGLDRELLRHVTFMRVTEVTGGQRGDGHAHYHVYFHSPYIPHELARHLWGKALRELGYATPMRSVAEVLSGTRSNFAAAQLRRLFATRRGARKLLSEIYWPVVDIQETYGDIERELVKYLVKDTERDGTGARLVEPAIYARIYEGLEGVRSIATSRRFFDRTRAKCGCAQCGSTQIKRHKAPRVIVVDVPASDAGGES